MKSFKLTYFILAFVFPLLLKAQTSQQEFRSLITSIYNFYPHNLNTKQIEEKSTSLDKFWETVKLNKSILLPFLRIELADSSNNSFFLYDGSQLLLSLSKDPNDKLIALNSIIKVDLRDVQNTDYLYTVHRFSRDGLNTTAAAFHILDYPEFSAYIVQHALTIDQKDALLYMLLPIFENIYIEPAINRLHLEHLETSLKSLLNLLWYSVTEKGDSAIAAYVENIENPENVRKYAKELQSRNSSFSLSSIFGTSDFNSLKQERIKVMNRISDESLYELDDITKKIRIAYKK